MSGWECLGLLLLAWALFTWATVAYIRSDNKPRPRWPGDP